MANNTDNVTRAAARGIAGR